MSQLTLGWPAALGAGFWRGFPVLLAVWPRAFAGWRQRPYGRQDRARRCPVDLRRLPPSKPWRMVLLTRPGRAATGGENRAPLAELAGARSREDQCASSTSAVNSTTARPAILVSRRSCTAFGRRMRRH